MTTETAASEAPPVSAAPPTAIVKAKRQAKPLPIVHLDFDTDQGFALAQRRASALSAASAMPEAFRGPAGSPGWGNALIALELAHRLNFPPLLVIQNLTIIDGKPGWQGKFFVALVQSGGQFRDHDWEIHDEPAPGAPPTDSFAKRMVATRISDGKRCVGEWVSVRMAKEKGWWTKVDRNGVERSHWPSMTGQMLTYRSASFWTNQWNPGATLGIRSTDEIEDTAPVQTLTAPPPPLRFAAPLTAAEQTVDTTPVDHTLEPGHDPVAMENEPQALADLRSLIGSGNRAGARAAIAKLPKELQKAGADLYSSLAR